MDVITTALTAAITDGNASAAYQMLKSRLSGRSPRVDESIADLEQDPGSLSRQFAVSDALAAAGLAGDRYLRAAARNLVDDTDRRRLLLPSAGPANAASHAVLQVFYATDRQATGDRHPARQFGAGRGELSFGSCEVSVPRGASHEVPALPTLVRMQPRTDANGHAQLLRCETVSRELYFRNVAEIIGKGAARSALLFVHGYRASFEDAARQTARLAHDLGFGGVPVCYSWPSQGRLSGYAVDETNIDWAQPRLAAFLLDLLQHTPVDNLYLLGHGMGNRALVHAAAAAIAARPDAAARLREVILAVPDIPADVFRHDIAPALTAAGNHVTLYASSGDGALAAGQQVPGHARAGDSGVGLAIAPGIETIDAGTAGMGFTGHPRQDRAGPVLADLQQLIGRQLPAAQRAGLLAVDGADGRYWTFNR